MGASAFSPLFQTCCMAVLSIARTAGSLAGCRSAALQGARSWWLGRHPPLSQKTRWASPVAPAGMRA
eukprot:4273124-Pyramimonas_sp.AAC.1